MGQIRPGPDQGPARPVPSNLLAGVQLAMTQPIRIDDVVIVESEWDTIAEITSIRNSGTLRWPP